MVKPADLGELISYYTQNGSMMNVFKLQNIKPHPMPAEKSASVVSLETSFAKLVSKL